MRGVIANAMARRMRMVAPVRIFRPVLELRAVAATSWAPMSGLQGLREVADYLAVPGPLRRVRCWDGTGTAQYLHAHTRLLVVRRLATAAVGAGEREHDVGSADRHVARRVISNRYERQLTHRGRHD